MAAPVKHSLGLTFSDFYSVVKDPRTHIMVISKLKESLGDFGGGGFFGFGTPRIVLAAWDSPTVEANHDIMMCAVDFIQQQWVHRNSSDMVIQVLCDEFQRIPVEGNPNLHEMVFPVQITDSLVAFQNGLYQTMIERNFAVDPQYEPNLWNPRLIIGSNYPNSGIFIDSNQEDFVTHELPRIQRFSDAVCYLNESNGWRTYYRMVYDNEEKYEWGVVENLFPA